MGNSLNIFKSPYKEIENPGSFDELNRKVKEIYPANFEGGRIIINKGLSSHFQANHTINMGNKFGYRFGATFIGTKQYSPTESFPVLLGEMDLSGNLSAQAIHKLAPNITLKYIAEIKKNILGVSQASLDYRGKDYSTTLTIGNPNLVNLSGILVAHYLQCLTPNLAVGGEIVYQKSPMIPNTHMALLSLGGKYTGSNYQVSASLGLNGINAYFYHRLSPSSPVRVGVEVETSLMFQESTAALCYQVDLDDSNFVYKGFVNSEMCVGGVLEKKLTPLPFTLALSALLNHSKNTCQYGVGLMLGS